jgi:hypothetical protein
VAAPEPLVGSVETSGRSTRMVAEKAIIIFPSGAPKLRGSANKMKKRRVEHYFGTSAGDATS